MLFLRFSAVVVSFLALQVLWTVAVKPRHIPHGVLEDEENAMNLAVDADLMNDFYQSGKVAWKFVSHIFRTVLQHSKLKRDV